MFQRCWITPATAKRMRQCVVHHFMNHHAKQFVRAETDHEAGMKVQGFAIGRHRLARPIDNEFEPQRKRSEECTLRITAQG